jgi:hypothetical protein
LRLANVVCNAGRKRQAIVGGAENKERRGKMMGSDFNPIYKEYYSHENSECYKIDFPWSKYKKSTMVLCKVSEGYEHARNLAIAVIARGIVDVTEKESAPQNNAETASTDKQQPK